MVIHFLYTSATNSDIELFKMKKKISWNQMSTTSSKSQKMVVAVKLYILPLENNRYIIPIIL